MSGANFEMRPGEQAVVLPENFDAGIYFIGRLRTPWATRAECPHHGALDGPLCRIEIDARWRPALRGLHQRDFLQVLYFMELARRDLVIQTPHRRPDPVGVFAIRSPARPNPIASSKVKLEAVQEEGVLLVRGLDCVDETPLVDLKPEY